MPCRAAQSSKGHPRLRQLRIVSTLPDVEAAHEQGMQVSIQEFGRHGKPIAVVARDTQHAIHVGTREAGASLAREPTLSWGSVDEELHAKVERGGVPVERPSARMAVDDPIEVADRRL